LGRVPGGQHADTLVHDAGVLRFLADQVGTERIMLGSYMPFPIGDLQPAKIVAEAGFSASEMASMTGGLAQRLFVK